MSAERKSYTDTDMREAFYLGAQALFTQFTSCAPFPAREMMDAATKAYPEPREFRTATINGIEYRFNDGVFQLGVSNGREVEWSRAVAVSPGAVQELAKLIDNPYEETVR